MANQQTSTSEALDQRPWISPWLQSVLGIQALGQTRLHGKFRGLDGALVGAAQQSVDPDAESLQLLNNRKGSGDAITAQRPFGMIQTMQPLRGDGVTEQKKVNRN